jgi:hypothetical protein
VTYDPGALVLLLIPVLVIVFVLPSIIGAIRQVENLGFLIALNFIGGATFVAWPAAMIWALMIPSTKPRPIAWTPPPVYLPGDPAPPEHYWMAQMLAAGYDYETVEAYAAGAWPPSTTRRM